jgi:hypothetical protein
MISTLRPYTSDSTEFEQVWPNVLNNFFVAETVRTAKRLRAFSPEGRDNKSAGA